MEITKEHNQNKANTVLLKSLVREPYAWPGGYERLAVTSDGGLLCSKCLKSNFRTIMNSTKYMYRDGWQIDGACYEAVNAECAKEAEVETCFCDHCGKEFGELA